MTFIYMNFSALKYISVLVLFLTCFSIHGQTTILQENFEHAGAMPVGWTQQNVSGAVNWISTTGGYGSNPSTAHGGTYNALFYSGNYNNDKTKLITPVINLNNYANCILTFFHSQVEWTPDIDTLKIYYKTSAGGTWIRIQTYSGEALNWTSRSLALPNTNSTYYLAFEGISSYGYGVCIDDIAVTGSPVYMLNAANNGQTFTTCSATVCDEGGPNGNYFTNNADWTITFASDNGGCIRAVLQEYNTELNFDSIYVYDGPNTSSPQIGERIHGKPFQEIGTVNKTGNAYYAQSGYVTIRFSTDGATIDTGFTFKIDCPDNCVAPPCTGTIPAGDNCGISTPICDFNGYCGNTDSTLYTTDHANIDYYGLGIFCGGINNNSWLSFVADSSTAILDVWVYDCQGSFYGTVKGIQLEIFDTDCNTFIPVSNCWSPGEQMNGQIKAGGLTVGNTYILMIDGYAKDNCKYVFAASQGLVVADAGQDQGICEGEWTWLEASGGTSVTWSSNPADPSLAGQENDMLILVSPSQTTTYTAVITGSNPSCPGTADATVYVDQASASFTGLAPSYCVNSAVAALTGNYSQGVFSGTGVSGTSFNPANAGTGTHNVTYTYDYSVVTAFFDDFDPSPNAGWTHFSSTSDSWQTGKPKGGNGQNSNVNSNKDPIIDHSSNTSNNVYGQGISAGSGDGVGGYYDNASEWLKTPVINCSSLSNTTLTFWRYANFEPNWDEAYVRISTDNTNWTDLGEPLYPLDDHWTQRIINISQWADGQATVYIRWSSASDNAQTYSGWNIDDIRITGVQATGSCTSTDVQSTVVYPLSIAGTANTPAPICAGSTASITLSGYTGTIQWQQSVNGSSGWTNVTGGSGATSATYTTAGLSSTLYFRAVVTNGSCSPVYSNTVMVTVNLTSVGGAATATSPICSGTNSTVTLSGNTGSIQWQSSPDGSTWTNLPGATISQYITSALTTTTYYRAVVTSGVCTSANSSAATVTVSPASIGGTASASPNSMCSGNNSVITVSGYTGSIQWQESPNGSTGWTNIPGATSVNYTTPALTTTTYYRAVLTSGAGCTSDNSSTASVTVTPQSSGGTATPINSTLCYNVSASITLSGYSGNIQWQQSPNGSAWSDIAGATSSTLNTSNLTATTYFHAVVSNAGCAPSNSNDVLITVYPNFTAGTIASNQTLCAGFTPAGLTQSAVPAGGTGTYTYQWQSSTDNINWFNISGATNIAYNPPSLSVTTYYRRNVTSGSCGTVSTNTVIITVNPNPVADAGVNQNIFNGANTTLAGSASGGSGSYSFSWTPSGSLVNANIQNPQTVNLFSTTVFTLTVNDINTGCQGTDQVTVFIIGGPLSIVASAVDYSVCRGTQVQLSAVGSGGNPGSYQYTWTANVSSFTSTLDNPTDIPTINTIYTVSLFDGTNTVTDTVNVTVFSLPIADAGTDASVCNGNSTTISAVASTGTPVLSYNWSNGTSGVSQTVSPTTLTSYTVTVTDGYGCNQTDIVVVTVNPLPIQFAVAGGGAYCSGGTGVSVSLSGSEINVNYQLQLNSVNTGVPVAGTGSALLWNNLTSAGTYTIVATTSFSCTGQMLLSASVIINPLPSPVISGDIDVCEGETEPYSVTNISGHSYSWNISGGTPATASSSSVDITWGSSSPGIITLTETIASTSCAVTTNSYAVIIHTAPVAFAGNNDTICAGEQITISAVGSTGSAPLSYLWNNGVGVGISHIVTPGVTINYTVIVTDFYMCTGTDQVSITVNSLPVIDAGNNVSICTGSSANIMVTPISGTLPFSYTWDNGLGSSASHNVSPNTTTIYHVTVVDAKQCTGKDSVIVVVFPAPVADAGLDEVLCKEDTAFIDASASSGTQPLIFSWSNSLGNGPQHLVSPLTTTSYYLTITDNNFCKDYDTVIVTVNFLPIADAGNNVSICSDIPTPISASLSSGVLPLQFIWSNNIDTVGQIVFPHITTTYYVTVTDANNCINTDSVKVTVAVAPVANAGLDVIVCSGTILNLDASLSIGSLPLTYFWNNNIGTGVSHSIVTDSNRIYVVNVTDVNNCTDIDSISVTVKPVPDFSIQTTNTTCAGNKDGKASVVIISAVQPVVYMWSTGNTETNIAELLAGNYSITITDSTNCQISKSFEIKDAGDLTCLEIPSAFTPNADGTNDKWEIKHIDIYPKATVEIYNRWGEIIFSSDNYSNPQNYWDGKYKGNEVTAGSYIYILNLNNDTDPIQGVVTVIR